MNSPRRVTAIVVNYRTGPRAVAAVQSLLDAKTKALLHVVVVDNDSGDGSYDLLLDAARTRGWDARVTVLPAPENGGFGSGNNLAIRRVLEEDPRVDFVYLLNPDALAEDGSIDAAVDFMEHNPTAGIAGSRITGMDGRPHNSAFRFPSPLGELEAGLRFGPATRLLRRWVVASELPAKNALVDWVAGCGCLIRREVFEKVGLFDEEFFLYFEETDLCARAARAGLSTWYVPASHIRHEGAVATGIKDPGRPLPAYWFESRERFFMKTYGAPTLLVANALFVTGYFLFRVRSKIQQRPDRDPPNLFSDFLNHFLPERFALPEAKAKLL